MSHDIKLFNFPTTVNDYASKFKDSGFVHLPGLLTEYLCSRLEEIFHELRPNALRKDFLMSQTAFTPRHLYVINGHVTLAVPLIRNLYSDHTLLSFLEKLVGVHTAACPILHEAAIFTSLEKVGDTHGWHLDDFPITFIFAIKMPRLEDGGDLEFIDVSGQRCTLFLRRADAYIMRSDKVRHRVRALKHECQRCILNFTYGEYGQVYESNGTADQLCL